MQHRQAPVPPDRMAAGPGGAPRRGVALAGLVLLIVLAQSAAGLLALWRETNANKEGQARVAQALLGLDAVRNAQAAFALQTQEWKNILLRGHSLEEAHHYSAAHAQAAERVGNHLDQARASGLAEPARISSLLADHHALLSGYAEALKGRDLARQDDQRMADDAVQGQDRSLQARLDELGDDMLASHRSIMAATVTESATLYAWLRALLLGSGAAVTALLAAIFLLQQRR